MCRTYRIPHSTLIADWSDVDAALAIAYEQWRRIDHATRCHQCGTHPDDWIDDSGAELVEPAWELETVTCQGCRRRDARQEQLREEGDTGGRTVRFRRHIPAWDPEGDGFDGDDLVVLRWDPDDPEVEQVGRGEGLSRGATTTAPLSSLAEWAAKGWIVARGPDDLPLRASRPDAANDGTV